MTRLRQILPALGGILATCGVIVLYLSVYGQRIQYTQTYSHLAKILPPAVDVWMILTPLAFIANICFFLVMPNTKFVFLEILQSHPLVRLVVGLTGLIICGLVAILLITGLAYQFPRIIAGIDHGVGHVWRTSA